MHRFRLPFYIFLLVAIPALLVAATRDVRHSAKEIQDLLGTPTATLEEHVGLGHVPGGFTVNKFGYNAEVTDADEESIWDVPDLGGPERCNTVITDTATAVFLSSSAAGDATESVTIEGLTTDYVIQNLTVALGATAATTGTVPAAAGTWLRINRMYATTTALAGDIYVSTAATDTDTDGVPDDLGTIVAAISAGENQTLQACYTVPDNHVALLASVCLSNTTLGGANPLDFRMRTSVNGYASRTQMLHTTGAGETNCHPVDPHRIIEERTDIEFTGSGTTQAATAIFGLIVLPDEYHHHTD
jgi:hypothetical protein